MKNIFQYLTSSLLLLTFHLNAQDCELPGAYPGTITGSNMTIMLLPGFMQNLPNIDENAYVVAISESGFVFGSAPVYGVDQTSLAVWGDDISSSDLIDGAEDGELISFQLISGDDLYQVAYTSPVNYQTNGLAFLNDVNYNLIDCSIVPGCIYNWADNYNPLATEDDGSCYLYGCLNPNAFNYNSNVTYEDSSCLFGESYLNQIISERDALQELSDSFENQIVDLQNQLSLAMQNQDDGVYQADVDALEDQIDTLILQIAELSHNSLDAQLVYFENQIDVDNPSQYNVLLHAFTAVSEAYAECNPNVYGRIPMTLYEGWNMIAYNLLYETNAANTFISIFDKMMLLKSNDGNIYWPLYNFNGIGVLLPGQGYQIKMNETVDEFYFE